MYLENDNLRKHHEMSERAFIAIPFSSVKSQFDFEPGKSPQIWFKFFRLGLKKSVDMVVWTLPKKQKEKAKIQ